MTPRGRNLSCVKTNLLQIVLVKNELVDLYKALPLKPFLATYDFYVEALIF